MIQTANLNTLSEGSLSPVLPGEVDGLSTSFLALAAEKVFEVTPRKNKGCVYLFTGGMGRVQQETRSWEVTEIGLFVPRPEEPFKIISRLERLEVLELAVEFSTQDRMLYEKNRHKIQSFQTYSSCGTYQERVKSPKTISRTLLPEYTFPRLCIGSVETSGPDEVATHRHPMLEQFFYGLKDNNCTVRADQETIAFSENQLVHIPLGSSHGVEVQEGNTLHYIWIDLFKDEKGMEWITQEHVYDE